MVKLSRCAIQFLYRHVLGRLWINIVKPPKQQVIQAVLSLNEVAVIINTTRKFRYQVFYLTTYSLGLRLSESLNLTIADIDSELIQVHVRNRIFADSFDVDFSFLKWSEIGIVNLSNPAKTSANSDQLT